jgi:RNA polymerase sigma-70 factor (ECF subfamily)
VGSSGKVKIEPLGASKNTSLLLPRKMDESMNLPITTNNCAFLSHTQKQMSDEWLVLAAKDGDDNAFVELRDRHSPRIVSTAYRITRNWEDAEDALQDTFLKAFTHLNRFEGRSSFSTWVTKIAINMSLMILRKKRANKELSIDASGDDFISDDRWELRDRRETPERRYVRNERAELLRKAIGRLDPILRSALELQQAQDYSIQEIGDSLGISSAAAKSRLLRARVRLRTVLQNKSLNRT